MGQCQPPDHHVGIVGCFDVDEPPVRRRCRAGSDEVTTDAHERTRGTDGSQVQGGQVCSQTLAECTGVEGDTAGSGDGAVRGVDSHVVHGRPTELPGR